MFTFARKKWLFVSVVWSNTLRLISSHEYSQNRTTLLIISSYAVYACACFETFLLMFNCAYVCSEYQNADISSGIVAKYCHVDFPGVNSVKPKTLFVKTNQQQTEI